MRITSHEIILPTQLIRRSEHLCNQTQIAKQRKIAKINPAFRLERKRLNKGEGNGSFLSIFGSLFGGVGGSLEAKMEG